MANPVPTPHTQQIERSFRRAFAHAGETFTFGEVTFKGFRDAAPPLKEGIDRNDGDSTAGIVRACRADFPDGLPAQGDIFTDADARSHRVASVEYVPGHPIVAFHLGNIQEA